MGRPGRRLSGRAAGPRSPGRPPGAGARGKDRDECADGDPGWGPPADATYPVAYDVALDVGTAIVARVEPVGGGRPGDRLENEILEVDADLEGVFG